MTITRVIATTKRASTVSGPADLAQVRRS